MLTRVKNTTSRQAVPPAARRPPRRSPGQSAKPRRGRPPIEGLTDARRAEILDCAVPVFARMGYSKGDVQEVADRLGIAKGTIYRYFPSKQSLFCAAVDRAMAGLKPAVETAARGITDPIARIHEAVRAYLTYFDSHPEYVELMMQERAHFRGRRLPSYFAHREANVGPWKEMYRGLIAVGRVRGIPVERITDTLGALLYGAVFINYFAGRHKSVCREAKDILDIVFNGVLTERRPYAEVCKARKEKTR